MNNKKKTALLAIFALIAAGTMITNIDASRPGRRGGRGGRGRRWSGGRRRWSGRGVGIGFGLGLGLGRRPYRSRYYGWYNPNRYFGAKWTITNNTNQPLQYKNSLGHIITIAPQGGRGYLKKGPGLSIEIIDPTTGAIVESASGVRGYNVSTYETRRGTIRIE